MLLTEPPLLKAEFVRVPLADKSLIILGEEFEHIEDQELVVLADIFPTAWVGLTWSGFQAGDTVAIFGAGPVGLLAAYSAIIRGASRVYSIDRIEERLEAAASIGAIPINFTKGEPSAQILAREPNGVQRTVDCVGEECVNGRLKHDQSFVITQAVECTCVGGGVGVIGVHFAQPTSQGVERGNAISPTMTFPMTLFWEKNLTMRAGTVDSKLFVEPMLELVKSGRARPGFVFSSTIGIDDAPTAYRRFSDKLETKVLIKFPSDEKRNKNIIEENRKSCDNLLGQVATQPTNLSELINIDRGQRRRNAKRRQSSSYTSHKRIQH
jgi:threonine dehydrogenase-like Zn-dependent dehydrogenase